MRAHLNQKVMFDNIINNPDRKGGHILLETPPEGEQQERIWGIDHGICFHEEHKLRTVIWEFAGLPIPENLLDDLHLLQQRLAAPEDGFTKLMNAMLASQEVKAIQKRIAKLLMLKNFPHPGPGRHYPWPPV